MISNKSSNIAVYLDFGKLKLIEYPPEIIDVLVKLLPDLALRMLELGGELVLEPRDLFARHASTNECHDHDDVTQAKRDPADQECLVESEQNAGTFCVVLACFCI